ncbi:predicted protein [Phaeodactylum tricornutum CCAP 1055/1]|jgi:hypothetical protein|uniref:Uncharacterized protein n=1 Tax=Phaeodactylum tricornutum (strain CCAP 1055/1) TaxID=556484 RepID=B7G6U5_PHATC|nr:predicted protein [Phaeodactylum tricornutum CCAP 1055/1]EEC45654.1 predicted protein [Phaeodactylum tricornutum CCAP 1055/1]|eukprot:XP_002182918.1 predicted protein [Phaeodactylum tricornutum CCAP 1055/1]
MASKTLFATGTVLLLHAAYSCLHYRSLLQELEDAVLEDADSTHRLPPVDVWIEAISGFLILLVSELMRAGSGLHPISKTGGTRLMAPSYQTRDFDIYSTRSKAL